MTSRSLSDESGCAGSARNTAVHRVVRNRRWAPQERGNGAGGQPAIRGFLLRGAASRLAAARAGLPVVPQAESLELQIEARLFHERFDFGARLSLADWLDAIGYSPDGDGSENGVELQFANIDFIEGVRRRLVVLEVVGHFLVGHQRGNAFEEKIEVVGAKGCVEGEVVDVPA